MVADKIQTFAAFEGKVDGNTVKGVSIIQEGPALGHGMWVDKTMLEQVKAIALRKGKIKAKVNHWSGLEDTVGYYENFRIRASKLIADLQLFESSPQSAQLLEMIESIPESFGVSIVFASDEPEHDEENDRYNARCKELYSADFVDTPAANRDGVFEAGIDNTNEVIMAKPESTPQEPAFDAQAAIAALTAQVSELKAALEAKKEDEPKQPEAPAPDPIAALSAKLDEQAALIKALSIAPKSNAEPAPANDQGAAPEPPKSYADARKEAIGTATGLARLAAIRAFEKDFPTEAAYAASFKK
jgi:hypothetical protein